MRYTNPNDIKTDHLSGASALTVGGLQAVIEYFKNTDTVLPEKLREDFHAVWKDIVDAQPFMASLRSAIRTCTQCGRQPGKRAGKRR